MSSGRMPRSPKAKAETAPGDSKGHQKGGRAGARSLRTLRRLFSPSYFEEKEEVHCRGVPPGRRLSVLTQRARIMAVVMEPDEQTAYGL